MNTCNTLLPVVCTHPRIFIKFIEVNSSPLHCRISCSSSSSMSGSQSYLAVHSFCINTLALTMYAVPQLERCSSEAKFVSGRAKIIGLVYFSPSSLLISKKKGHRANLVYSSSRSMLISKKKKKRKKKSSRHKVSYLFPGFMLVSKKKSHHLKTAARERGVWVGKLNILGGKVFV